MRVCHPAYFIRSNVINPSSSGGSTFTSKAIGKPSCSLAHCRPPFPLLVYTSDIQKPTGIDEEPPNINEPPSQRHIDYCKVSSNRGLVGAHNFLFEFMQPDYIPPLPFHCQLLLHVAPHYRDEEPNALMDQIEAYLAEEPATTARPNDYHLFRSSGRGADCHSQLSLRCAGRLIR
ncbi:hypothetical protein ARMSODRAFT_1019756 [Armillaria solidipes]|uniref:Uncharacterized protein n=1 Tax=Armillaria solidipes TaxID=1076256 RepID=A0A2H3BMG3_9AGAR|nr:hypothetical protein ARMSODRAFT_1019756 [Armillaria solidipes]